jgi:hypothetical protein
VEEEITMSNLVKLFCLFLALVLAFGGAVGIAATVAFDGFDATLTSNSFAELTGSFDGGFQIDGKTCGAACGISGT